MICLELVSQSGGAHLVRSHAEKVGAPHRPFQFLFLPAKPVESDWSPYSKDGTCGYIMFNMYCTAHIYCIYIYIYCFVL